jgi:thiol-disulfide isomerase/thioredoxin
MNTYLRTFKAEWLKLKRTGTFWICFGAAAFIPVLQTCVVLFVKTIRPDENNNAWNSFIQNNFSGFTGFFFPVFLIIIVARIVYMEHRSDTWKLLETQPVPRAAIFGSKAVVFFLVSLFCLVGVLIFSLIGGFLIQLFSEKAGYAKSSIDWALVSKALLRFWISSLGFISLQYFLGLWSKNFALPLAIGLVSVIAGSMLSQFGIWTWWPYSAPSLTSASYSGSISGQFLMHNEKMSLLWALLFLLLGYTLFIKKSFVRSVFVPYKQLAISIGVLIAFVVLAYLINKPVTLSRYHETVLAGKIKSEKPVSTVVLVQAPAFDTVLSIPVVNGSFHTRTDVNIEPGIYTIRAGSFQSTLFFGNKDSLFLDIEIQKRSSKADISGTRIAENAYLKSNSYNDFYVLKNFAYNFKPNDYADQVLDEWEAGVKAIRKFKTSEKIKPAEDFIKVQEKLLAIDLLNLAEVTYPQVFALYNPNEEYKFPAKLETIRKNADMEDNSLASYAGFITYIGEALRKNSGKNDSIYFSLINTKIKNDKIKNTLYFETLNDNLGRIKDSAIRNNYLKRFLSIITSDKLQKNLLAANSRFNNLQRGKKAHIFTAENIGGKEMKLGQLVNRYVVVDVWATWCGPCKRETPYFEEMATKYTDEKVVFVGISVDEDKMAWKMEAPHKSKRVLQLWATNAQGDFMNQYGINTIPRFMLIDPKGNIVNANMPPPSDPEFEKILQKEIPEILNGRFNYSMNF